MAKQKLTPWFPGNVKPVRVGVYERKPTEFTGLGGKYSFWNGNKWLLSAETIQEAAEEGCWVWSFEQKTPWRGVAK